MLQTETLFAYIGPGAGAGAIAIVIGILTTLFLVFMSVLWYPFKRLARKFRNGSSDASDTVRIFSRRSLVVLLILTSLVFTMLFGWSVKHTLEGGNRVGIFGDIAVRISSFPSLVMQVIREKLNETPDHQIRVVRPLIDLSEHQPIQNNLNTKIDGLLYRSKGQPIDQAPGWRILVGAFTIDDKVQNAAIALSPSLEIEHLWLLTEKTINGIEPRPRNEKFIHGFDVLRDGSVVFAFDGGVSIQRIDADGRLIWARPGNYHHSVTLDHSQNFVWTLRTENPEGSDANEYLEKIAVENGQLISSVSFDSIIKANPEIDILEIRKGDTNDHVKNSRNTVDRWGGDPFHTNDVDPLPGHLKNMYPLFEKEDLLISLRSINLVLVVDPDTLKIKWWRMGATKRQHDPDWNADGNITVFDNRMGRDYSRIVSINPNSMETSVIYGGPSEDFYSRIRGKHQITSTGHLLITSSQEGRLLEVDANKDFVLEIVNQSPDQDYNYVISQAIWLPTLNLSIKKQLTATSHVSGNNKEHPIADSPFNPLKWLFVSLLCIAVVEMFLLLPIITSVLIIVRIGKKSIAVFTSKKASERWKQKFSTIASKKLFIQTVWLTTLLLCVASAVYALLNLFEYLNVPILALLIHWTGIVYTIVFSYTYVKIRRSRKNSSYGLLDRLLHRMALQNPSTSKLFFFLDQKMVTSDPDSIRENRHVFVSGLARAGTTVLMRQFYETGLYRSLTYRDMPFVLAPNFWEKVTSISRTKARDVQRAHGDNIIVNVDSPESFDEVYWRTFCGREYIESECLRPHIPSEKILDQYVSYVNSIIHTSSNPSSLYLCKNNNNILRIESIKRAFPNSLFLIPFRNPLQQAASLLRQHQRFTKIQKDSAFTRSYMTWLGHHEFGLAHRPFVMNDSSVNQYDTFSLDYWLERWSHVYSQILKDKTEATILVCYEDLCTNPNTWKRVTELAEITDNQSPRFKLAEKKIFRASDDELLRRVLAVYENIRSVSHKDLSL